MLENEKQAYLDIENSKVTQHRWLINICALLFLSWSFLDFYQNEPLSPIFFLVRFVVFTIMILFAAPLNKSLFQANHYLISSIILTAITSFSVLFSILSQESVITNSFFVAIMYLSTSLLFQANKKYFLPIIIMPIVVLLITSGYFHTGIIFGIALAELTFLSLVTFIAHFNIYRFSEKSYSLRIELEDKKSGIDKLLQENNQLLRILCHDLGNAITIVEMSTTLLEKNVSPPDNQAAFFEKNIDRLKRATNNQKEIIEHVRQKEALESGKEKVEIEPVSLNVIFEKIKFIFQNQLTSKKINLSINYSNDKSPYVMAEMVSLSNNVINNIISNSIKFSPDGSEIIISTWHDKNHTFVTIEDFGIGMDERLIKDIFSSNIKTSRPGVRGEKGTGFGMPLAKFFMDNYGGEIVVESRIDKGTRFTLKFLNIDTQMLSQEDPYKLAS